MLGLQSIEDRYSYCAIKTIQHARSGLKLSILNTSSFLSRSRNECHLAIKATLCDFVLRMQTRAFRT